MVQLNDLSDDCLIEVLDRLSPGQLFKMQRLNKRMKLLAEVKMRINIKEITWIKGNAWIKDKKLFSRCHEHLGSSSRKQRLLVGKKFKNPHHLATKTLFLNLLTKCTSIKSLEFVDFNLPGNFLFEVVNRCPELECFKLIDAVVEEEDWSKLLDQIGHKLVHFEVRHYNYKHLNVQVHNNLLAIVAAKCPNIKRVDWSVASAFTVDVVAAFKKLPNNCWVTLDCKALQRNVFVDVIDELMVSRSLDWCAFGNRITRLSKLYFCLSSLDISRDYGFVGGIEFTNLKTLEFYDVLYRPQSLSCLVSNQFPRLEEFTFNANCKLKETGYDMLFQTMTSIKKLTINYKVDVWGKYQALLPQSSIGRLENLETVVLKVLHSPSCWQPGEFVKNIEPYVDWITSLKKMIIQIEKTRRLRNKKTLVDAVKRMQKAEKKKQEELRVEIDLIFAK